MYTEIKPYRQVKTYSSSAGIIGTSTDIIRISVIDIFIDIS